MQLYRHSGAIPLLGGLLCLIGAAAVGLAIGFLNAYLVHWSPLGLQFILCIPVPTNYFLTIFCAAVCGWLLRMLRWHCRIRSAWFYGVATVLAFGCSQWSYWSVSQFASGWAPPSWHAWSLAACGDYAEHLLQKQSGWLVVWWICETATVAAALFVCVRAHMDQPFCERCDWWTETTIGFLFFPSNEHDEAWVQFRSGDVTALDRLPLLTLRTTQYMRLDLASCKSCADGRFVAVQKISPSPFQKDRKEGKGIEDEFIPYHHLTPDDWQFVQSLMELPDREDLAT